MRLVQIDAPEVYFTPECYGEQASAITKRLWPPGTVVRMARVYTVDGDDLDDYNSSESNWSPGDVVYAGSEPSYRIRSAIPLGDLDNEVYDGIWEVEEV